MTDFFDFDRGLFFCHKRSFLIECGDFRRLLQRYGISTTEKRARQSKLRSEDCAGWLSQLEFCD
jgi:hypothetical protein